MSAILALDLGTTTGWAMRTADGRITSGTASFKPGRYEADALALLWLALVRSIEDA